MFGNEKRKAKREASLLADELLADDVLTEAEEEQLSDRLEALGLDISKDLPEVGMRVLIAKANSGRLQEITPVRLMLKQGEVCHMEAPAAWLKEVTLRHTVYSGRSAGVSFRIAKGVRVRTGGAAGTSHVVIDGTRWVPQDSGLFTVTSKRIVFMGDRKNFEVAYSKLLGMEIFKDALTVSAQGRSTTGTFRFTVNCGPALAATINAAAQLP